MEHEKNRHRILGFLLFVLYLVLLIYFLFFAEAIGEESRGQGGVFL